VLANFKLSIFVSEYVFEVNYAIYRLKQGYMDHVTWSNYTLTGWVSSEYVSQDYELNYTGYNGLSLYGKEDKNFWIAGSILFTNLNV
jgi:hypothetical protein